MKTKSATVTVQGAALAIGTAKVKVKVFKHHETLLDDAKNFLVSGNFNIAIILACTAAEVSTASFIEERILSKGVSGMSNLLESLRLTFTFTNENINDLYQNLTGDTMVKDQNFWQPLKASVRVRNGIVHKGEESRKSNAEICIKAVGDLISYLARKKKG
jgi:hypothetical protein